MLAFMRATCDEPGSREPFRGGLLYQRQLQWQLTRSISYSNSTLAQSLRNRSTVRPLQGWKWNGMNNCLFWSPAVPEVCTHDQSLSVTNHWATAPLGVQRCQKRHQSSHYVREVVCTQEPNEQTPHVVPSDCCSFFGSCHSHVRRLADNHQS